MCHCRVKECIQDQFKIWITFCEDLFLLFFSLSTKLFVSDNKHIHTCIIIKNLLHSLSSWDFTGLMPVWYQVASSLSASSSYVKSLKTRFDAICCMLLDQTYVKLVDKKFGQSTCIKSGDNLQQTCRHAQASEVNASWCWLDDCNCKITSLQQTFWQFARFWLCLTSTFII